ncbi:phosphatidylcholine and lysophosphatidylcholine phospholipase [Tilletia horrida]|uniref:Lysophospholipase NTE1 n=1 Tax=Tilletia horrida TaxID=155126 RepID=A0AAN6JU39_9BASI|nr:phosphatidylcholine and lysophosphatidylcholine phospholipase [Tilletia horrida]KAK0566553.1 phosphatidylcholine and lysophosphatidylcholine phospholipase [Tilletia horrida]
MVLGNVDAAVTAAASSVSATKVGGMKAAADSVASRIASASASASGLASSYKEAKAAGGGRSNPVTAMIAAMFSLFIASLNLLTAVITFGTITIPSLVYRILHYSLILQLNFPVLALLFMASIIAASVWLRYGYFNKYERLREEPLAKDEGFNLHPDLVTAGPSEDRGTGFQSYLDEFLQAIRIFGFLEKPVFHELARHLQTRRLVAGDSLALDSDFSFYIVIDGHVQVFAPSPEHSPVEEDEDDLNGFQLLNEVSTGGTLSSLFNILSLFTEDVKLGMREEHGGANAPSAPSHQSAHASIPGQGRAGPPFPGLEDPASSMLMQPNFPSHPSKVAQGHNLDAQRRHASTADTVRDGDSSTIGDGHLADFTATDHATGVTADAPFVTRPEHILASPTSHMRMGPLHDGGVPPSFAAGQHFVGTPGSIGASASQVGTPPQRERPIHDGQPNTPGSILSGFGGGAQRASIAGMNARARQPNSPGHVARATVDTTLAVIPAEAFKRLTKKFPNAAAHIVQVILTRFSRVTFHTAHQFLGLTKEMMQTERALNSVASFGLPADFYEKGGMERLRQRFLPEAVKEKAESPVDYFTTKDSSYHTAGERAGSTGTKTPVPGRSSRPPQTPWGHPDLPVMTPIARSRVGPGDLFSMTTMNEDEHPAYPHGMPTPRSERRKSSRSASGHGHSALNTVFEGRPTGKTSSDIFGTPRVAEINLEDQRTWADFGPAEFDLKDAIFSCLSRSIGLTIAPPSAPPSVQASPYIHAQDSNIQRSVFNSAFSSLSMLEAASANLVDDESSVVAPSSMSGLHHLELENEIEIRFFPAGTTVVHAGEKGAGLFYVIDGFLDVILPPGASEKEQALETDILTARTAEGAAGRAEADKRKSSNFEDSRSVRSKRSSGTFPAKAAGPSEDTADSGKRPRLDPIDTSGNSQARRHSPPHAASGMRRNSPKVLYTVRRGDVAGYLSSLLNQASYVDVKAKTDTYVGYLPAAALTRMMERKPVVLLTLCKRLLSLLSPLILHIDSALDWQQVNGGQVIYREGDPSDSFYIVINGRLRAISEKADGGSGVEILQEFSQGESVGELDVITALPRRHTLHAIRDSELAKMPMTLFNAISMRHPQITIQISRIIARRVRAEMHSKTKNAIPSLRAPIPGLPDLGRNNQNLKTVAILPVTREVPIVDFANRLQGAFEDTIGGPTAFLNQSSVMSVLGKHAFSRFGKLKLAGWLAEQEQQYRLVLYVVDTAVSSPWAQTSIRQADCVLLVGFGDDPSMGEYERLLLSMKTTARKELVLLHPDRSVSPGSTREWLKTRPWIQAHHHLEIPGMAHSFTSAFVNASPADLKALQAFKQLKEKLETRLSKYRQTIVGRVIVHHRSGPNGGTSVVDAMPGRPHAFSDFARLARRLRGRSVGLVLGGGGARGCSHVGVLRALEERGIPVDMIGGTSIGSLVGGLYAKEGEVVSTFGLVKRFAGRMASLWRFASDLTYPVVSYTTGHEFNRGIYKALGASHIEDFWIPYFTNSTNITWSRMEVHTTGYAWRYIRASMTLAGLLPPLVDEGNMLVDGGYVDNLPVSVMFAMGARDVFAVDVGSIDDTSPRSYGDTLSGWWVLLNRFNPWSEARMIPSIPDIQGRLTYVSSVKTLEEAKVTPGCLYMRMPVEAYGTLEFGKFAEIAQLGYDAANRMLDEWVEQGVRLPNGTEDDEEEVGAGFGGLGWSVGGARGKRGTRRRKVGIAARRNSI